MNYAADALAYCAKAVLLTFIQIVMVLGLGVLLGLAMNTIAGYFGRHAYLQMGRTIYLYVFGWLGTAVHELGHAVFCPLFGHRIKKIELFNPDPVSGKLGYVRHSYNKGSLLANIGNFFIGIGPILLGTAAIYLFAVALLDININMDLGIDSAELGTWSGVARLFEDLTDSFQAVFRNIFSAERASSWELYLFLYLAFSIGTSITLSPSDIQGTYKGFVTLLLVLLLINLGTLWIGDLTSDAMIRISKYCSIFYAIMLLSIFLSLFAYAVVIGLHKVIATIFRLTGK